MAESEPMTLALTLQRLRTARGLTQEELAAQSGVSVRTISDIERGISRAPHRDTLQLLGEAMALSAEEAALLQSARQSLLANTSPADTSRPEDEVNSATALIGREADALALRKLLTDVQHRMVTLIGPAGIGKTRLALALVALLQPEFDATISFIDLTPVTDAAYVVSALAHALGVREHAEQPLLETLVAELAERRMLLVVDNFEHVLDARPALATILTRCPQVSLLVTSRYPLELPDEHTYPVAPLATPNLRQPITVELILRTPAAQLFIVRATAAQPGFSVTPATARTIARICARLGGIPLAIELAAAWVGQLAPQEILAQLSQGSARTVLTLLTRRADAGTRRQRSMRDALSWSYHLLDAHEQVIFRRLGIFAGGWSVEAAEAICGPPQSATLDMGDTLLRLASHSLIFPSPAGDGSERFSMHTVIVAYAQTLLDERKERATLARRHAVYFTELVERLEQGLTNAQQQQSLARLVDEYENIRAALRWTREHQEYDLGLRLVGALWWFWETRGYTTEGREWVEGMLRLAENAGVSVRDESMARALYCATVLAAARHDHARAEQFARAFLLKTNDPTKRARALLVLGNAAKFKGDRSAAEALYSEGLTALRALNDTRGMFVALNNLSAITIEQGDLERSLPLVEESLALKRQIGDRRGIAVSLMNLGEIQRLRGEMMAAQQTLEEGLQIFQSLDDRQGIALSWNNLGELAIAQGEDAQAVTHFAASLHEYQQMEDKPGEARALLYLGETLTRLHDYPQAEQYLHASTTLFESLNQPAEMLQSLVAEASLAWAAGRQDATIRLLDTVSARLAPGTITLPEATQAEYERLLAATTDDDKRQMHAR